MNTSLSWIKRYVPDLNVTAKEYADAMTLSGTKVENYEELDRDLDKIVVGEILTCEDHPNSDHLHVCTVNVGADEPLQIVCGALRTLQKVRRFLLFWSADALPAVMTAARHPAVLRSRPVSFAEWSPTE